MRKLLVTISIAMLLAGSAQAADNYTCATPPSCATLGYTLTSTADCIGTPLRCPFDTSKIQCTTKTEAVNKLKDDILTASLPNYDAEKVLSCGSKYTVGSGILAGYSCGWVLFSNAADQMNRWSNDVLWRINDKEVGIGLYKMQVGVNTMIVPVKKMILLNRPEVHTIADLSFILVKGYNQNKKKANGIVSLLS